jgi:hypothetical protein
MRFAELVDLILADQGVDYGLSSTGTAVAQESSSHFFLEPSPSNTRATAVIKRYL